MATWYTVDEARAAWSGAPMDDDVLQTLLDASQEAVLTYAPERYTPTVTGYEPVEVTGPGGVVTFSRDGQMISVLCEPSATPNTITGGVSTWTPTGMVVMYVDNSPTGSHFSIDETGAFNLNAGTVIGSPWTVVYLTETAADPDAVLVPSITEGIRQAHLLQARNIWNAARVDPAGQYGTETFQIAAFPLDWQVKQLIRPTRAVPVVA